MHEQQRDGEREPPQRRHRGGHLPADLLTHRAPLIREQGVEDRSVAELRQETAWRRRAAAGRRLDRPHTNGT